MSRKMRSWQSLLFGLALATLAEHSMGAVDKGVTFRVEPPVQTLNAAINVDLGEQALNELLEETFVNEFSLGTGGYMFEVQVRKVMIDLEAGSARMTLDLVVEYNIDGHPKSRRITFSEQLAVGDFEYGIDLDAVRVRLARFRTYLHQEYGELPEYVRADLADYFEVVDVYAEKLIDGFGDHPPDHGKQIVDSIPVFFQGEVAVGFSLEDDFLRVSLTPAIEVEHPRVELQHHTTGRRDKIHKIRFVSNFKCKVRDFTVTIAAVGAQPIPFVASANVDTKTPPDKTSKTRDLRFYYHRDFDGSGHANHQTYVVKGVFESDQYVFVVGGIIRNGTSVPLRYSLMENFRILFE